MTGNLKLLQFVAMLSKARQGANPRKHHGIMNPPDAIEAKQTSTPKRNTRSTPAAKLGCCASRKPISLQRKRTWDDVRAEVSPVAVVA